MKEPDLSHLTDEQRRVWRRAYRKAREKEVEDTVLALIPLPKEAAAGVLVVEDGRPVALLDGHGERVELPADGATTGGMAPDGAERDPV